MDVRPFLLVLVGTLAWGAGVPAAWADGLVESPDGPEHVKVYFTETAALAKAFAGADSTWTETWRPTAAERADLEAALGWHLPETSFVFHRAQRRGRDLGTALILEEKGRFKPITFLVRVDPGGKVGLVLVMVYRESRGDAVRRQRFLRQFDGRTALDPLRLNRDVVGISGATMSSRALAAGVRKALVLTAARGRKAP
ncbi:MAG: FMN-binding protein [Candidatus Krumholzibacteriia bacterium]